MAANDMYQYSPGILTNILARKRAEEQQALENDMAQKKFDHQMEMDKDTQETNRLYREAYAQNQNAQALEHWLKGRPKGQVLTPEDAAQAQKLGGGSYVNPGQTQMVETTELIDQPPDAVIEGPREQLETRVQKAAGPKGPDTFAGTEEQNQLFDKRQKIEALRNDPEFLKKTPMEQWMIFQGIDDKLDPPADLLKGPKRAHVFDAETATWSDGPEMEPGDTTVTRPRKPQGATMPFAPATQYDQQGNPVATLILDKRTGQYQWAQIDNATKPAPNGPATPDIVPSRTPGLADRTPQPPQPGQTPRFGAAPVIARPPSASTAAQKPLLDESAMTNYARAFKETGSADVASRAKLGEIVIRTANISEDLKDFTLQAATNPKLRGLTPAELFGGKPEIGYRGPRTPIPPEEQAAVLRIINFLKSGQ